MDRDKKDEYDIYALTIMLFVVLGIIAYTLIEG